MDNRRGGVRLCITRKDREPQLHIISTGDQTWETFCQIAARVHEQVDAIHLREKSWSASQLIRAIHSLTEMGVPLQKLIVNDRIDVAYMMQTKGVQLAHHSVPLSIVRRNFPNIYIGSSVHSVRSAVNAEVMGADQLLYGHIFPTRSKPGIPARGLDSLRDIVQHVSIPVIAIGGITPENIKEVTDTGVSGIAALSGVFHAKDPLLAVKEYREQLVKRTVVKE